MLDSARLRPLQKRFTYIAFISYPFPAWVHMSASFLELPVLKESERSGNTDLQDKIVQTSVSGFFQE